MSHRPRRRHRLRVNHPDFDPHVLVNPLQAGRNRSHLPQSGLKKQIPHQIFVVFRLAVRILFRQKLRPTYSEQNFEVFGVNFTPCRRHPHPLGPRNRQLPLIILPQCKLYELPAKIHTAQPFLAARRCLFLSC